MSGRRESSLCNRSESLSGSRVSERSTSSGKVATVVSFAVVNVDLDDKTQDIEESKNKTKKLVENACMSATESMKDSDEPSYKVKLMSYAIRPDRLKQSRIRRDRHDYSEKVRNPTRHSDDDRIVSFISGEGSVKTDELSKTRYDSSTSDRRSRRAIHSGREADRNSIKSSRRRLQFDKNDLYTSSSSRTKRSKSSRSTKRRPSYSRRRRSRRYQRSRRGRINRQRKSKSMLSKKRKPRKRKEGDNRTKTERRSKRPEVVSSEKPLALQSVEEDENQPQTSPLKVLAFNEKDQLHLSTKPEITSGRGTGKSTKETTPYYTAKNTRYRTLYEGEYTPTMASMGVKSCNCDECIRYERRAQTLFAANASRKHQATIHRGGTGMRQVQQSTKRPFSKVATKTDDVNRTQSRSESQKPTTAYTLTPVSPSGSLHTDFNIILPPTTTSQKTPQKTDITEISVKTPPTNQFSPKQLIMQRQQCVQANNTEKLTTTDGKSLKSSTQKELVTSANYNPERDYNPMCDCTNCQIQRSVREKNELCDCYDCISAMRNNSLAREKKDQVKQKQYKLKDPPVDGHVPKPPRRRTKPTYPWVKRLIKIQQPGKAYHTPKQRLSENYIFKTKHQREHSYEMQLRFPSSERSASTRSNKNSPNLPSTNQTCTPTWSLLGSDSKNSPVTRTSRRSSTGSYSKQTDQSSFSTYNTPGRASDTRSSYSSNRYGTRPSSTTNTTISSTYTSTTPTTTAATTTATTNQSSTHTERTETSSDDYTNKKNLTINYNKKLDKRKPWLP